MKRSAATRVSIGIGNEAVQARTGRSWSEWFKLLDAAGARELDHPGIVAILRDRYAVGAWWQQMITVAFEQAQGMRKKHQRPDGYQISASRTITAPLSVLYGAWTKPRDRKRWLGDARLSLRKATRNRSVRLTWGEDGTHVEVMLNPKGPGRNQVTIQHSRLADAASARRMKAYWRARLEELNGALSDPQRARGAAPRSGAPGARSSRPSARPPSRPRSRA